MLLRILTASLLIPVAVAIVWWGPLELLAAAAALAAMLAITEFFVLGERVGLPAFRAWALICAAAIFYVQYQTGLVRTHTLGRAIVTIPASFTPLISIPLVLLAFMFGAAILGIGTRRSLHDVLPAASVSCAGLIFVALPFSYLVRLAEVPRGRQLVLFTLVLVWAGDVLAYFIGRAVGRWRMAPALSPKKTWEGAAANLAGSVIVAVVFARWLDMDAPALVLTAALANVAGQIGDLIESAYKRGAVVKDSGGLLPGHGGMLDRIDSLIFAAPVVWLMYVWLLRGPV